MLDLLGDTTAPGKRSNDRPQAAAPLEVLMALHVHPAVSLAYRQNSEGLLSGGRFIRFGWPDCPDVLGQLRDGRFLGCEVKSATRRLRPEQAAPFHRAADAFPETVGYRQV